jgi:hypothetical protein
MKPVTSYYLGLYLLVFVIRFFKIQKDKSKNGGESSHKHYFFTGLEMVYTTAGFVILLDKQKDWTRAIMIFYILLVIIAVFVDSMDDKLDIGLKFWVHLTISVIIIGATIIYLNGIFGNEFESQNTSKGNNMASQKSYLIMLPYKDLILAKYLGYEKYNDKMWTDIKRIRANNETEAVEMAISRFEKDENVIPFEQKRKSKNICY